MENFTISINDIIYNNFFLALLSGLLAILLLFIDRCIFIKKNNYITYIKLFLLITISVFLVLTFKDTYYNNDSGDLNLQTDNSPFK